MIDLAYNLLKPVVSSSLQKSQPICVKYKYFGELSQSDSFKKFSLDFLKITEQGEMLDFIYIDKSYISEDEFF